MNDASEMRLFMNGLYGAVIEKLNLSGDYAKIHKAKAFFEGELEKEFHYSAYAACFSQYRDDAAQWERYGRFGQGVCIAFRNKLLREMIGGAVSLQKVYYQADMHDHQLVGEFYDLIKKTDKFSECLPELQRLMNEAWVQSAAFKHPSFSNEKEFRLVVSPFILDEFPVEPKYHVAAGRIKKYYPLDLNRLCERSNIRLPDLVGEIIIGPTSSQSLPILQDYLKDSGLGMLKDKISLSDCPLRKPTP